MAGKGFNGPSDIFEGKDGLLHAYSFQDHYDGGIITKDLGERWEFTTSSIKVYPCCRYSGGHTDACLEIVEKYHPKADDIEKIRIRSSKYTMRLLAEERKWNPQNIVDLQFSMPFQAAVAFVSGKVTVDEFDMKHLQNPVVKRLIASATVVEDPEFERRYPDQYSSAVTITMKDGAEYTAVVDNPKGDKRNPVSHADVENKFRYLANRVYSDKSVAERIVGYVNDLENQRDISELVGIIVSGK
jgi:2-methylcitrate dehydratase PrpD